MNQNNWGGRGFYFQDGRGRGGDRLLSSPRVPLKLEMGLPAMVKEMGISLGIQT